jgi:regulator of replication initiation timing
MTDHRDSRNGEDPAMADPPPLRRGPFRRPSTLDEVYDQTQALWHQGTRIADALMDTNERLGQMLREVSEIKAVQREMRVDIAELKDEERMMRRKLESVPEIVKETAEETGRHHVRELELKLTEQARNSLRAKVEKQDDRRWQVILPILVGVVMAALGFLARHLLVH